MKKTILFIVLGTLCLNFRAKAQTVTKLTGRVVDSADNKPIHGATIKIKSNGVSTSTGENGEFILNTSEQSGTLIISFIGYRTAEIGFDGTNTPFAIYLVKNSSDLKEVSIVSTGYQNIPKERATGSFSLIDSTLLNRRVSTNILDRLNGSASGIIFNQNSLNPNSTSITIRGTSTLFANDQPLIVLDNFPYNGDPNNINPEDIANVTLLKDAAAASIWGVRAGNGVIVITTKKGRQNGAPQVNFNSSLTVSGKPDLYYSPQLSSSQYVGVEKFLFNQGYYYNISDGYSAISPVQAALSANQNGTLSTAQLNTELAAYGNNDVRSDINKYLYRTPMNQQYQLSVSGGGNANRYYVSAGFDDNLQPQVTNSYDRATLNANNTYSWLKNRVEWTTGILFTQSTTNLNNNSFIPSTPYEMLKDASGNNLAVVKDLRTSYIDTAGAGKLLDWRDIPLNDNYANEKINLTDYRFSNSVSVKVLKSFKLSVYYLYEKGITNTVQDNTADSYSTRSLVNTYTQIDPITGNVTYVVPPGDVVSKDNNSYTLNTGRVQLNFDKRFGTDHELNALAGYEISDYNSFEDAFTLYGYNPSTVGNGNQGIDFADYFPQYYGFNTSQIPTGLTSQGTIDRNRSYFANASYAYKKRYIFTGSARRDESNIFGVNANQKGVPLWSGGVKWKVSDEPFYKFDFLPQLALRATYGYNGNTDKTTTAYLTTLSVPGAVNSFNAPYLFISNPPNPSLRWEKVAVTNLGVDFGLKDEIVTGSIEYYIKNATDLIANSPVAQQTGVAQFRGNSADMRDNGIDIALNIKIVRSPLQWNSTLFFSYVTNKVTHYLLNAGTNDNIVQGNYQNPLVGYPLYAIFSYPSTKLDNVGNPRGYFNGQVSEDYQSILNSTDPSQLKYNGSATPLYFGNIINNFDYRSFELSIGIGYKLDYYFRRTSLNYTSLFGGDYHQADFNKRWQKPGDENVTTVPSMIYPADPNRDEFYTYSNSLVDRADNIRLQDVRFSYTLSKRLIPLLPVKSMQFYLYANNLVILWRANHDGLDPDSPYFPPVTRSISIGIKASL